MPEGIKLLLRCTFFKCQTHTKEDYLNFYTKVKTKFTLTKAEKNICLKY